MNITLIHNNYEYTMDRAYAECLKDNFNKELVLYWYLSNSFINSRSIRMEDLDKEDVGNLYVIVCLIQNMRIISIENSCYLIKDTNEKWYHVKKGNLVPHREILLDNVKNHFKI